MLKLILANTIILVVIGFQSHNLGYRQGLEADLEARNQIEKTLTRQLESCYSALVDKKTDGIAIDSPPPENVPFPQKDSVP